MLLPFDLGYGVRRQVGRDAAFALMKLLNFSKASLPLESGVASRDCGICHRSPKAPSSFLHVPAQPNRSRPAETFATLLPMELREFAERVLFATTLEEKLQSPGVISDERPGSALGTPDAPGRPRGLNFKPTGTSRGEFPGTRHLEQADERGRLLHFFANHELLATELMALVLLKFPDRSEEHTSELQSQ